MNRHPRTALALAALSMAPSALAQEPTAQPAPGTPVLVQMPDGTYQQGYAVTTSAEPKPEPKHFAITANPLNLYIGRFGVNFEYQPVLHHGLIVSPHYDHVSFDETGSDINGISTSYQDSFSGFGTELGYRLYTGEKGFNGFFFSPSLLLATYTASGVPILGVKPEKQNFTSIGWAWEVGGQAQIGSFIIGGGGGMQYTKVSKDFTDLPVAAAIIAGGGWRPRILLNLGGAF